MANSKNKAIAAKSKSSDTKKILEANVAEKKALKKSPKTDSKEKLPRLGATSAKIGAKLESKGTESKKAKSTTIKPPTKTSTKTPITTSSKTAIKASLTSPKSTPKSTSPKKSPKTETNKTKTTKASHLATKAKTTETSKAKTARPDSKHIKEKKSDSGTIKENEMPFEINEYVFYPNEGLGRIIDIENRKLEEVLTPYYVIEFPLQKMINRVPIKNCKKVKIRKIITKAKAQAVLKVFSEEPKKNELSWKDRLILYQEINGRGNSLEIAEMLASLYIRRQTRNNLSFQERQVYDFALESLSSEIAVVLGMTNEEAQKEILDRLTEMSASTIVSDPLKKE